MKKDEAKWAKQWAKYRALDRRAQLAKQSKGERMAWAAMKEAMLMLRHHLDADGCRRMHRRLKWAMRKAARLPRLSRLVKEERAYLRRLQSKGALRGADLQWSAGIWRRAWERRRPHPPGSASRRGTPP